MSWATLAGHVGTYSNGRGEWSQTDAGDLNVPLAVECEVVGLVSWLERVREA